ncbi:hypothetical protein SPRG_11520 [Saprolegnia parasitica CBS 223.65]|uniref:Cilia- and flagella-associated protein 36 n=1 Tax=Saprolegnia parasitica (strain CBS 223.65) TaxID=695850 RepID=A0A067C9D3_SAPPC|nr:hypothetical protein SPRG_11520 [Saprolegnia parasitica CBS 223.65]KDO23427.1 hypothetical protein SPRG_11520 [Saprolegnia parasitica CBS 223.65]|eukprot:XP_012205915.1 hypothetical protein SPRG_11520 [Saprolegnia parasitica CBS 223.65]
MMDVGSIQDDMIRELMVFIASAEFQAAFEDFFLSHALTFSDEEEHRLEYTAIFQKFQSLFEDHMQRFYEAHSITEADFAKRCRAAVKADPKASQYLDIVLASMDYQAFFNLMKFMRKRAATETKGKRKFQADAKDDAKSGDTKAGAKTRADDESK